jgi:hypothetical protein
MISYLIASNKPFDILRPTLESIHQLTPHKFEIVVCAPEQMRSEWKDFSGKLVVDEKNDGSTHAFNLGASHCSGEWIVVGTDEHLLTYDVSCFLSIINSSEMKTQDYQIINLGSPWNDTLHKQIISFPPINTTNIPENIQHRGYPVITFPAVSRKTIETQFNGMLFNPYLLHHFVDHWIGCFVSAKQPNVNLHAMGNAYAWRPFRSTIPSSKWDNHDANVFCNLAAKLLQGHPCQYTDNPFHEK